MEKLRNCTAPISLKSRSGQDTSGLKVKSVIHWVDANHSLLQLKRLYEQLFTKPDPASFETIHEIINPESLIIPSDARLEKIWLMLQ